MARSGVFCTLNCNLAIPFHVKTNSHQPHHLMLQNYILITLRSIVKNKIFILINVLGMGIAVACCIVAYLNWEFSSSFDQNHTNAASVYRVQSWQDYQGSRNRHALVPNPLGNVVRENFTDVDEVVRYTASQNNFRIGDEVFNSAVAYTDSTFFDLFSFEFKSRHFFSAT